MNLEDRLRDAMQREQPSKDFAGRVRSKVVSRRNPWRAWAAGALAASLMAGGVGLEWQRSRERANVAHSQLLQALAFTSAKLQNIQRKVEHN